MLKKFKIRPASMAAPPVQTVDIGSLEKPIPNFTPGLWKVLGTDRSELNIDLFRPIELEGKKEESSSNENLIPPDETESDAFPYDDLRPLLQFRQLQHLKLTGMTQSYQRLIWAACWLNPFLKTVHLEMALKPVFNDDTDHPHRPIGTSWALSNHCSSNPNISEYLGHHGDGTLHDEFGGGEYLDTQAIRAAMQEVAKDLPWNNLKYLPVEKLTLMNFVVDAGAIMRWFDPIRFKELEFKEGCIDAGFYLLEEMKYVKIASPKPKQLLGVGRMVKPGEFKVVELKKGKVISRKDAMTGKEELPSAMQKDNRLKTKITHMVHGLGGGKNKENKLMAEKNGEGVKEFENAFSDIEIREAKDGKKPIRD